MVYAGEIAMESIVNGMPVGAGSYSGVAPEFFVVLYRPGDIFGLASAVLSLVPPLLLIAHLAVFLTRRQASDLYFAGGQVICEALNQVLKHVFREPRPLGPVLNMPQDSYGMPSAHSQFMGYYAMYTLLKLARDSHIPRAERALRAVLTLVLAAAVGFSRFYLYYHSAGQVVVGLAVGAFLATLWFLLDIFLRVSGLLSWALGLWPFQLFCVKDTPYDVRQEYAEWLSQAKTTKSAKQKRD